MWIPLSGVTSSLWLRSPRIWLEEIGGRNSSATRRFSLFACLSYVVVSVYVVTMRVIAQKTVDGDMDGRLRTAEFGDVFEKIEEKLCQFKVIYSKYSVLCT